jgi:DNA-binding GntR family transcriptional regulator
MSLRKLGITAQGDARGMLDQDSPVPLWKQLAAELRRQIESGEITGRVPSIITVAQTFEVGHSTAQRALATLRDEGLITGSHGRGYYVKR